jgi:hypothetical protein
MTNFNYKKFLTENKLTQTTKLRAGMLAEGQFSWMTQDTGQQIGSQEENMIPVHMYDNEGNSYYESNYDGYGEFGGMDYYELLDKMNGGSGDRSRGIDLAFDKIKTDSEILYPALVSRPNFDWKSHDFTKEAKHDPNQSWYMEPEEDDYNGEDYGDYNDMMEEIDQPEEQGKGPSITYPEYPETELKEMKKVGSFKEWLEGVQDIPNVANDFKKHPELSNAKSKEEFIKMVQDLGKLYDKSETKTQYHLGDTIYVSEFPVTGTELISLSSGLSSYGNYIDETNNFVSTETSSQAQNRIYPQGSRMDENKETTKMKKSDLKTKIKEMILAEMNVDIDNMEDAPESEVDFLAEVDRILKENNDESLENLSDSELIELANDEGMEDMIVRDGEGFLANREEIISGLKSTNGLNEASEFDTNKPARIAEFIKALDMLVDEYHAELYLSDDLFSAVEMVKKAANEAINLNEAEDEVAVDDTEVAVDGEENVDVDTTVEVDPNVKAVQDSLTQAQAAAQKLGDPKLTDQIGNTITFFTRAHVVEKGAVAEDLNESMFPMLKRILK